MFGKKKHKKVEKREFDATMYKPVLKCSICNGEQVAGFQNLQTGKFEEVAFIRNAGELQEFLDMYGLAEIEKVY